MDQKIEHWVEFALRSVGWGFFLVDIPERYILDLMLDHRHR